jgi:hypothetical protein
LSVTSLFDILSPFRATIAPFFAAVVSATMKRKVYMQFELSATCCGGG